jgi:hypothetical protein
MINSKPNWWQLIVLGILVAGLLFWVHSWNVSESVHGTANIAIVLTANGAFFMWLSLNEGAIEYQREIKRQAAEGKLPPVTPLQARYRYITGHHREVKPPSKTNPRA